MAEETTETTPVVETTQTTTETPTPVAAPVVAEAPKPAPEKPVEKTVPLHRFNEVYRSQKDLEREVQALRAKLEPATPAEPSPPKWEDIPNETEEARAKRAEKFNAEWVDYRVSEKLKKEREAQRVESVKENTAKAFREADINYQQKAVEAATRYPDFHEAIEASDEAGIMFQPKVALFIRKSEKAGDLAYYLAKNPAEAVQLNGLHPDEQLVQLGRIESKLSSGNSKPEPKITKAPAPPTPVNAEHSTKDPSTMSQKEYNLYKNGKLAAR